jgi:hypothetical protein
MGWLYFFQIVLKDNPATWSPSPLRSSLRGIVLLWLFFEMNYLPIRLRYWAASNKASTSERLEIWILTIQPSP